MIWIAVDSKTDALIRLFCSKIPELKTTPNKIKDINHPPMENAVNGYKGELAGCECFDMPFGWELLKGQNDGGSDVKAGNSLLEFKTSWYSPQSKDGCHILNVEETTKAQYIVGVYGVGVRYLVFGWVTREEYFKLRRPILIMRGHPPGLHSRYFHPIDDLLKKVSQERDKWGPEERARLVEYRRECEARRSAFERELWPPEITFPPSSELTTCGDCHRFEANQGPNPRQGWGRCLERNKGRYGCATACEAASAEKGVINLTKDQFSACPKCGDKHFRYEPCQ